MIISRNQRSTGLVTCVALLISTLLPRSSVQAQEIALSAPPVGMTTEAQVERVLEFTSVREILATMGDTPASIRELLAELPDEAAVRVRTDLLEISPEPILEAQLVANGYTPEEARATVSVLTPAEIDQVVQYDSMRGGYVVVVPLFMMMFVMISVAVVAVTSLLIWDHARKSDEARMQKQMVTQAPVAPTTDSVGRLNRTLEETRKQNDISRPTALGAQF